MASPPCSLSSEDPAEVFIRSVDVHAIEDLALTVRLSKPPAEKGHSSTEISCSVISRPKYGSYNVVYEVQFSDGISWAVRLPFSEWTPLAARKMEHDMLALNYIASRISIPIPTIHAYSSSFDNPVRNAYIVMDKAHGVPLSDVWHDPSWWTGIRRKEHFFESLAQHMVQLASLPFNRIGRLVSTRSDGSYVVGPFPSLHDMFFIFDAPDEEFGPFSTTHEYLTALLGVRRRALDSPALALLQLFVGGLPDPQFNAAPFAFTHPDYSIQNFFVDDTGRISAMIDWDDISIEPLHCGALSYPDWLLVDWETSLYSAHNTRPNCDSEEDLRKYRRMYADAVEAASDGRLSAATRNSHITSILLMGIVNLHLTEEVALRLSEFVLGSTFLSMEVMDAIERSAWFTTPPGEVPEVKLSRSLFEPSAVHSDNSSNEEHESVDGIDGTESGAHIQAGVGDDADADTGANCPVHVPGSR